MINSGRKVNIIIPAYALKLGLKIYHTNIRVLKINSSIFKIFKIVQASILVEDKLKKARFFQKTFLLADISMEVVLDMFFLILSNANIQFAKKKFTWRFYTIAKVLSTIKRIKLIKKKKFAKATLDENFKTFMMHIVVLKTSLVEMTIYSLGSLVAILYRLPL